MIDNNCIKESIKNYLLQAEESSTSSNKVKAYCNASILQMRAFQQDAAYQTLTLARKSIDQDSELTIVSDLCKIAKVYSVLAPNLTIVPRELVQAKELEARERSRNEKPDRKIHLLPLHVKYLCKLSKGYFRFRNVVQAHCFINIAKKCASFEQRTWEHLRALLTIAKTQKLEALFTDTISTLEEALKESKQLNECATQVTIYTQIAEVMTSLSSEKARDVIRLAETAIDQEDRKGYHVRKYSRNEVAKTLKNCESYILAETEKKEKPNREKATLSPIEQIAQSNHLEDFFKLLPVETITHILVVNMPICGNQTALVNRQWNQIAAPYIISNVIKAKIWNNPDLISNNFKFNEISHLFNALYSKKNSAKTKEVLHYFINTSTGTFEQISTLMNIAYKMCLDYIAADDLENALNIAQTVPTCTINNCRSSLFSSIAMAYAEKDNLPLSIAIADAIEDGDEWGYFHQTKAYLKIVSHLSSKLQMTEALQVVFRMPGITLSGTTLSAPKEFLWALNGDIRMGLFKLAEKDIGQVITAIHGIHKEEMESETLEKWKGHLFHIVACDRAKKGDFTAAHEIIETMPGPKQEIIDSVQYLKKEKEKICIIS